MSVQPEPVIIIFCEFYQSRSYFALLKPLREFQVNWLHNFWFRTPPSPTRINPKSISAKQRSVEGFKIGCRSRARITVGKRRWFCHRSWTGFWQSKISHIRSRWIDTDREKALVNKSRCAGQKRIKQENSTSKNPLRNAPHILPWWWARYFYLHTLIAAILKYHQEQYGHRGWAESFAALLDSRTKDRFESEWKPTPLATPYISQMHNKFTPFTFCCYWVYMV